MTADNPRSDEILMAREIDTRIAAAYDAAWLFKAALRTEEETLTKYRARLKLVKTPEGRERYEDYIDRQIEKINELKPKAEASWAAATNLNATLYGGWPRFFLVQHIHKSLHCSSFRPTTRIGWLPNVSGLTETEAVAEYGATLCTICFPDAPTELTTARVDPDVCEESGKYVGRADTLGGRGKYFPCKCGKTVQRTPTGLARKHKK